VSTVYCENAECPEYLIAKDNAGEIPAETIICGGCNHGVTADPRNTKPGEKVSS
jgi:hypothetical protein